MSTETLSSSNSPVASGLGGDGRVGVWPDAVEAAAKYQSPEWALVWHDEFERNGLPDPAKWTFEEGRVRNNEAQFYTAAREANASISDGCLSLVARREIWEGADYTSASITTKGRFDFTYGKLQMRARVPAGRGTWPALWTIAADYPHHPWPGCGEIDLMEHVGFLPNRFHYTVHTEAYNHVRKIQRGAFEELDPVADAGFRDYGLIWSRDRLEWFADGVKVFEYRDDGTGPDVWPFFRPQYLLISLAVGGSWGGMEGIDETAFPAALEIEHVRVWQLPEPERSR